MPQAWQRVDPDCAAAWPLLARSPKRRAIHQPGPAIDTLWVCMIEVSSQDEKNIRVGCLLPTDVSIQLIQCFTPIVVIGSIYLSQIV
ncbi:hypothetical protein SRHO_G00099200 [Serrasalmus rhombeus]